MAQKALRGSWLEPGECGAECHTYFIGAVAAAYERLRSKRPLFVTAPQLE